MREIKFRAYLDATKYEDWHPDYGQKRMLAWDELSDGTDALENYIKNDISGVSPVMQYTGLKDKNGAEIYEGDIVSYRGKTSDYHDAVEWSPFESVAGFQVKSPFINIFDSELITVIGNIYENPELLEE